MSVKKHIGVMDVILIIVGIVLIAFTVTMIIVYVHTGGIPDTLCTCVFAALGGECGVMGWIKTTKDRHRERKYELEDRERSDNFGFYTKTDPPDGGE